MSATSAIGRPPLPTIIEGLRQGSLSATQLMRRAVAAADAHNEHTRALVSRVPADSLLAEAQAADARYRAGSARPLEGIPVAVKDNFCTLAPLPTTCASAVLEGHESPFEATAVRLLREAGALIVGKTNMDEFGMGSFSANSAAGPVRQPKSDQVAGGSSGGSAVAVQTGMALAALGSDTGGSVRLPASYCGVVGFKPSYGAISRYGLVPYAHSLDTVGVLCGHVSDARLLYNVLSGERDPRDMTSTGCPGPTANAAADSGSREPDGRPLRVGVPLDFNVSELMPAVRAQWSRGIRECEAAGMDVRAVRLPHALDALAAYYVLAPSEASSNLAKFDGLRYGRPRRWLGPEVQRRVLLGTFALSASAYAAYYEQAQRVRQLVVQDFAKAFNGVDVLLCPAALSTAPRLEDVAELSPTDSYVNDVLTVPASMAGVPSLVIPVNGAEREVDGDNSASTEHCHLGLQLIADRGNEKIIFDVATTLCNKI